MICQPTKSLICAINNLKCYRDNIYLPCFY